MGYMAEEIRLLVSCRTSAHNTQQDEIDEHMVEEIRARIHAAVRPIVKDPKYARVMVYTDLPDETTRERAAAEARDQATTAPLGSLPVPPGQVPGLASQLCPPGYVWLGDLAGFEIGTMHQHEHAGGDVPCLYHRCGWAVPIPFEGVMGDGAAYLANAVVLAIEERIRHTCASDGAPKQ